MMRKPIHCEEKQDYYAITHSLDQTNRDQPQAHNEPGKQQHEEECEGDHLESSDCTGDSGYTGSGASYIKLPIYAHCHTQTAPFHSHNTQSRKSSLPLVFHFSTCSVTLRKE